MVPEDALMVLTADHTPSDSDRRNGIIKGLNLLAEKTGDDFPLYIGSCRDMLFAGDFDMTVLPMTLDEVSQMARWGWTVDAGVWMHYTEKRA